MLGFGVSLADRGFSPPAIAGRDEPIIDSPPSLWSTVATGIGPCIDVPSWEALPPLTPDTVPFWAQAFEQGWQTNCPIPPAVWSQLADAFHQSGGTLRALIPHVVVRPELDAEVLDSLSPLVLGAARTPADRLQLASALRVRLLRGGDWPASWAHWLTWHIPASPEVLRWVSTPAILARADVPPLLLPTLSRLNSMASGPWPKRRVLRLLWSQWPDHHRDLLSRLGPTDVDYADPLRLLEWRAVFWSEGDLGVDWEGLIKGLIKPGLLSAVKREREVALDVMARLQAQTAAGPPQLVELPVVTDEGLLDPTDELWFQQANDYASARHWPAPAVVRSRAI